MSDRTPILIGSEFEKHDPIRTDESLAYMTGNRGEINYVKNGDETESDSDEEETKKRVREAKEETGSDCGSDSDEDDESGVRNAAIIKY